MNRISRRGAVLGALGLGATASPGAASAQAPAAAPRGFPDRPLRFVVPFAAGGGNDILARLYGQRLSQQLGQPVVVENRPGGFGSIGADVVMRSRPDGYTWMVHPSGPILSDPGAERPPYDLTRDFVPVAMLGTFPAVIVVGANSPHRGMADLFAWLGANPGRGTFGTGAIAFRLMAEMMARQRGTTAEYLAFRSNSEAVTSAAANEVTFAFTDMGPAVPALDGGRVRALAVAAPARLPGLPAVPTLAELGIADMDRVSWIGLFAPAGTPPEIVDRIAALVAEAGGLPEIQQRLTPMAIQPDRRPPEAFRQVIAADDRFWRDSAARAGIALTR
ncbi:tripartite tricarboxylate transporter substrate binding protein [Falsiroseomonas ponticola]|jgi:tripartite-type tricarboxylate transporter receptor subunit TctC|uniref:tripartite tricarboxylate transporter substrate binding protein n=1 Tax=Falsiroseomonas ponticola TaxID=2786951 RepID=UPI0019339746|nr:tripartite tricarboxylate transporter substrate binding protein [Roseomonas ponticola]